jgi:hypothetical protein
MAKRNPENQVTWFEENLRRWIGVKNPPPFVEKDLAKFDKFVIENCRVTSAKDSSVVTRALLLLHEMREWGFYRCLKHPNRPGGVRFMPDGIPYL